ncbi:MAG: FG-GAP-like repeat-containing protein [Nitrospirota bacterium]
MMLSGNRKIKTLIFAATIIFTSCLFVNSAFASSTWLSTIGGTDVPTRVALDSKGNLYVTEPRMKDRVLVFDGNGKLLRALNGQKGPIGIAVDDNGKIYVGNSGTGSVDVYNADLTFSNKLGAGNNEFKIPTSIVIGKNGLIYVADNKANLIKVYKQDGTAAFTFGGWGKTTDGKFNAPQGLAIDESNGELYVTDLAAFDDGSNGVTAGAKVQVFDLNGTYKRSFGTYGTGDGKLIRPLGIVVDAAGKVYITDAYQAVVHVFDGYGTSLETIYDLAHPLKTPIGIALGKDNRLFVASSNGPAVEVFGLPGYTSLGVSPASLSFAVSEGGGNPASQSITVSNGGSGTLDWTASADKSWISLAQATGTAGASSSSSLSAGINAAGLKAGAYTGTITIAAASGATETVAVTLTVSPPPAVLAVTPSVLVFKAQQNGPAPAAEYISIHNMGSGEMSWSAKSSQSWLTFTTASGKAPSSVPVTVNTTLPAGTQTGAITVTAPGAQWSPTDISVSVQIIYAGTLKVTTNLDQAAFDIKGPAAYAGTGKSWSNDEVTPGEYTITFKRVAGYTKPKARTITIATGKETTVQAEYKKKPVPTHIVAGAGSSAKGKQVVVLTPDGTQAASFSPFTSPESVRVATGDLDGSGLDKIVVTDNKRSIKVYTFEGAELASYQLSNASSKDAEVAVADLDGDGKAEIIVCARNSSSKKREIKLLAYTAKKLEEKATLSTEDKEGKFALAAGDINGDMVPELLVADEHSLRAFSVQFSGQGGALTQLWTITGDYGDDVRIAAGDIDGDEIAEIALSTEQEDGTAGEKKKETGIVRLFKGTGEDYGTTFEPYGDLEYEKPATVAMGDIDGDGLDEIAAGAGRDEHNESLIRIFKRDGSFSGTMKAMDGKHGVNVSFGRFQ